AVIFVSEESNRKLRRLIAAEASHIEKRIGLAAVHQQDGCAFIRRILHHLLALAKASASPGSGHAVSRGNHRAVGMVGYFGFGRKLRRWTRDNDRALQLAFVF